MAEITQEAVESKLQKGEKLTQEETHFVMSLPASGIVTAQEEAEEGIDWGEAEDVDGAPKKKETVETPEQKAAKEEQAAANKKKEELVGRAKVAGLPETVTVEEIVAAEGKKKTEEDDKDPFVKIERELQKPEGSEKLEGFTDREKAYFYQMRRDRRSRQKAEEERDAALFREVQLKAKVKPDEKPAEEDALAILKTKDPTDFMTVADVMKVVEKLTSAPAKAASPAKQEGIDPAQLKVLKMYDSEARAAHPDDYDAVVELSGDIINNNPDYLKKVREAVISGENPAEVLYALIKSDSEFAKLFPGAQVKIAARKKKPEGSMSKTPEEIEKEKTALKAQEALEKNKTKIKTSGHASGESTEHSEGFTDGKVTYSADDLIRMSDLQFSKVPKKIREAFLKASGA